MTPVRHAAALRRSPRLFRFVRVRLSRKLWGTYRITLRNIVSSTLGWMLIGIGLPAGAAPVGAQVVAGQVQISTPTAHSTLVNQATPKAVINWQSFGIGANESVKFVQPSSSSVVLNRIVGNDASQIFGALSANGQVFLVNPQGVYFAPSARVDTGALVASTLALSTADFNAGRWRFGGAGDAAGSGEVRNDGRISAASGGYVVLAGPQVLNRGAISASGGSVALLAGARVTLDTVGDGLVSYSVDAGALRASAGNAGSIQADGGAVVLLASSVANSRDSALATAVNHSGVIRANSVREHQGVVTLRAIGGDTVVTGVIDVSGVLGVLGKAAGDPAARQSGGLVQVLGDRVALIDHASINASGVTGGGTVLIGGAAHGQGGVATARQTVVSANTRITANANPNPNPNATLTTPTTLTPRAGDGGTVIVWSDGHTAFSGAIEARGGAAGGHGGFVETSGKRTLAFNGSVDTRAPHGATGTLLLDPTDITISSSPSSAGMQSASGNVFGDSTPASSSASSTSNLNTTALQNALASNDVTVDTASNQSAAGKITVSDPVAWSSASSLTLKAAGKIDVNASITNTGSGAFTLATSGAVSLSAGVALAGGAFSVEGAGSGAGSGSGSGASTRAASFVAAAGAPISTAGGAVSIATVGAIATSSINTVAPAGSPGAGGSVALQGGGVTQVVGTRIESATLTASTTGAISLDQANRIDRLGAVTATGPITLNNAVTGGLTISGVVTTNDSGVVRIANAGGDLTLGSAASVSGSAVTLTTSSSGGITLGGPVNGNAGAVTLTAANDISQTAAGAIRSRGALLLTAGGSIDLPQANAVSELGATSANGAFTFNSSGGALTVSGAVTTHDMDLVRISNAGGNLTLGAGGSVTGSGVSLTTSTAHDIVLGAGVDGLTHAVMLMSGRAVTQSAAGTITTTDALTVNAAGTVTLTQANSVGKLGAVSLTGAGDFNFNNTGGLKVAGAVAAPGMVRLTTSGDDLTFAMGGAVSAAGVVLTTLSAHDLVLGGRVDGKAGDVTLTSGGNIRQTAAGTINTTAALILSADGSITLDRGNTIAALGAVTRGGAFTLNDVSGGLSLTGSVVGSPSAGSTDNAVSITTAGGALALGGNAITASSTLGNVTLTGVGVTQTTGSVTAGGMTTVNAGSGSIALQSASNDLTGAVRLNSFGASAAVRAAANLTLAAPTLGTNTGLSATAGATLTLPAVAIRTGSGAIELRSDGGALATQAALTTTSGAITLVGAQGLSVAHDLSTLGGPIALTGGSGGVGSGVGSDGLIVKSAVRVDAGNSTISLNAGGAAMALNDSTLTTTNGSSAGALASASASIQLRNASGVTLGHVITGANGSTSLGVGFDVGGVTQTANTFVRTGTLTASTAGAITLDQANPIARLGAVTANGDVTLNSTASTGLTVSGAVTTNGAGAVRLASIGGDLTVGVSASVAGLGVALTTAPAHDIALHGRVDAGSGSVVLSSGGAISQSAAGTLNASDALFVAAAGSVTLAQANTVGHLGASTTTDGDFRFNSAGGLAVAGPVSAPGAVSLTTSGGRFTLDHGASVSGSTVALTTLSGGDLVLDGRIDAGAGMVTLASGQNISQTAAGTINTSGALRLSAGGSITLGEGNTIAELGAVTRGGDFSFNDVSGGLTLTGSVGGGTTSNALRITTAGGVLALGAFDVMAPTVGGNVTLTGVGVTQTTGTVTAGGTTTVNAGAGSIDLQSRTNELSGAVTLISSGASAALRTANDLTLAVPMLGTNTALTAIASATLTLPAVAIRSGSGAIELRSDAGVLATRGELSTTSGAITLVGAHGLSVAHDLKTVSGDIALRGGGSGGLVVNAGRSVDAGSATINVNGGGGLIALNGSSLMTTNDTAAALTLRNASGVVLGNLTTGASGSTTLGVGTDISGGVTQGAGTVLTTGTLTASTAGAITLDQANQIARLGAVRTNGALTLNDSVGVSGGLNGGLSVIGRVTTNGSGPVSLTNAGGDLTVGNGGSITATAVTLTTTSAGSIALGGAVSADSGRLTLSAAQNISQTAAGTLRTSGALVLLAGGTVQLDQANAVGELAAATSNGALSFNNTGGALLVTGGVTTQNHGVASITNAGGDLTVGVGGSVAGAGVTLSTDAASSLVLGGSVNGNAGAVTLASGQNISQTAAGTISTSGALLLSAGGSITLDQANTIAELGPVTRGGDFSLNDVSGGLALIGSVGGSVSAGSTSNAVRITTAGGALALGAFDVTAPTVGGDVTLTGVGVTQTTGSVTAGGRTTVNAGTGAIELLSQRNDFVGAVTLISSGASAALRSAAALTLAAPTIGLNTGLTAIAHGTLTLPAMALSTGTGSIVLRSDGGPLTTPGELTTTSGAITLVGAHGLNVAHDLRTVSGDLALNGGGSGGLVVNAGRSVDAGSATINVNGGGGLMALNGSSLMTTNNTAAALMLRNASGVVLGNLTTGASGSTTLGIGTDISGGVTQGAGTVLTTGTLTASTAGAITLDQVNQIARLGAVRTNGALTLNDSVSTGLNGGLSVIGGVTTNGSGPVSLTNAGGDLTVGSGGSITATAVSLTTTSAGSIALGGVVSADGQLTLTAAQNISQTAAGTLRTPGALVLSAGGTVQLDQANAVGELAAATSNGALSFNNTGGALLVTGGVTTQNRGVASITNAGGDLTVTVGGSVAGAGVTLSTDAASSLMLGGSVNGNAGAVTLASGQNISQTAAGTINTSGALLLSAGGSITLDQANTIAELGPVTRGGDFSLNDVSGGLALIGSVGGSVSAGSTTSNAVRITTTGGALALGAFDITATASTGNVTLTGVGVTQTTGAVTAGGITTVNAGAASVDLASAANRFSGPVNTSGANVALAAGGSGLLLGSTTASGTLTVTSSGGAITQTGGADVIKVSGASTLVAQRTPGGAAADITLASALNRFGGVVNSSGANVALVAGGAGLQLGDTRATGTLQVTSLGGAIVEVGVATVGDLSTFIATTTPGGAAADITLGAATNRFAGAVSSSGANVTLVADQSASLGLGSTTATGSLAVTNTSGAVTGLGALAIGGSTRVDALTDAVTLTNPGNRFDGAVTVAAGTDIAVVAGTRLTIALSAGGNASVAALSGDLAVSGSSAAALTTLSGGTTSLGGMAGGNSGSVVANALTTTAGGDVTQAGVLTVAGAASITSTGGAITLANVGNDFGATLSATSALGKDIVVVDRSSLMVALNAGGNASVTALKGQLGVSGSTAAALTTLSAGATNFGGGAASSRVGTTLLTTAGGDVSQSAALRVAGAASVTSTAGSIALGNVANEFAGTVTALATSAGSAITVAARNDLHIALTAGGPAELTALAGRLDVSGSTGAGLTTTSGAATSFGVTHVATTLSATAGSDLSQNGALTVAGATIVTSTGGGVALAIEANDFAQLVTASAAKDLTLTGRNALRVALAAGGNAAVTAAGDLTLVSGQTGAALTTLSGASTSLGAINVGTRLSTTAVGDVAQSDAVTVGATSTITATAGSVMLANAANRFVGEVRFSGGELRFQNAQDAIVQIKGVTGNASITSGGIGITLNGGYFNGPTLKLTSLSAPARTGVVLTKEADRPYFQLGEGMGSVSTALASQQDLIAFFNGAYPKTLIDGVPYASLAQVRLLAGSAMNAELADQERRERERSAGLGRLKEAIRLNTVTYEEIVAPLAYPSFEIRMAPCSKGQANGSIQCDETD